MRLALGLESSSIIDSSMYGLGAEISQWSSPNAICPSSLVLKLNPFDYFYPLSKDLKKSLAFVFFICEQALAHLSPAPPLQPHFKITHPMMSEPPIPILILILSGMPDIFHSMAELLRMAETTDSVVRLYHIRCPTTG